MKGLFNYVVVVVVAAAISFPDKSKLRHKPVARRVVAAIVPSDAARRKFDVVPHPLRTFLSTPLIPAFLARLVEAVLLPRPRPTSKSAAGSAAAIQLRRQERAAVLSAFDPLREDEKIRRESPGDGREGRRRRVRVRTKDGEDEEEERKYPAAKKDDEGVRRMMEESEDQLHRFLLRQWKRMSKMPSKSTVEEWRDRCCCCYFRRLDPVDPIRWRHLRRETDPWREARI